MQTSIIILTFNQLDYTKQCIDSIRTFTEKETYELIIVDNCSTDGTVEWLKGQEDLRVIFNTENLGFPKGCNQGIEIANGNNILLLNNDTVVTDNWLTNLLTCLYSDEQIGAVGPVTNSLAYYSTIPVEYSTLEEMHSFAKKYNNIDPEKWEERLKLIGFCLLIKKEVIENVGYLDEIFTPGNYEDDDYSLRMRMSGFKLMLCKDTFIHHYGSVSWKNEYEGYSNLLSSNNQKFIDKWGIDPHSFIIHKDVIDLITFSEDKEISILHIGCQSGGTLLQLKNKFKNAKLFGIEKDPTLYREASTIANVVNMNVETEELPYHEKFFDVIIYTDLEFASNPINVLTKINKYMKSNGLLLSILNNLSYFNNVRNLLYGLNPNTNDKKLYTLNEIDSIFNQLDYNFEIVGIKNQYTVEDEVFIKKLTEMSHLELKTQFETSQFLIKATPKGNVLEIIIENIFNQIDLERNVGELQNYSSDEVINLILTTYHSKPEHLNIIAMNNYKYDYHENVIPYLQAAYDVDSTNQDTLYNLGYTLYYYGQPDIALQYIDLITDKDNEVIELESKIKGENQVYMKDEDVKENLELKFLLRRIEFGIDKEESEKEFIQGLFSHKFSEKDVIEVVLKDIVNKEKIFNLLAIVCYENELYDHILPFLYAAHEIDNKNDDTLFNIGYFLQKFGENVIAIQFLNEISNKDPEVELLISQLEGRQE